jgi:hypothetical protein
MNDLRCPHCGALVGRDAEWCGQCFRPLGATTESEPTRSSSGPGIAPAWDPPGASTPDRDARAASAAAPTWPCPACGNANPIELDACAMCGTTFASFMRQDEAPPTVDARDALVWSLVYPGLGHRMVGRGLDGLARGVLFTMLAVLAGTVAFAGAGSTGAVLALVLFVVLALGVYVGSAVESYRLAEGGAPFVTARALLWATVGVIVAAVVVLALTVVSVTKR